MTFDNKKELCECINEAMSFLPNVTLRTLIGGAKTLEEATKNINERFKQLEGENHGTAIGTNITLVAKRYAWEDCDGCKLPKKYCRCTIVYNCELIEGSNRG